MLQELGRSWSTSDFYFSGKACLRMQVFPEKVQEQQLLQEEDGMC